MGSIRLLGAMLAVIMVSAWAVSGGAAPRMVVPEQAMGDAVVEALDGPRVRFVAAAHPTATTGPARPLARGLSHEDVERARLADYVDLHRGHAAPTKRPQPGGL